MINNIISKMIILVGIILLCPKQEVIEISNFCNSKVQRLVRNNYKYQSNCYVNLE